jgi:hypothetical protein
MIDIDNIFKGADILQKIAVAIVVVYLAYINMGSHSAEIAVLNAQIQQLKQLQYDNAGEVIKGQKNRYQYEKTHFQQSIRMLSGQSNFDFNDFSSQYMCMRLSKVL